MGRKNKIKKEPKQIENINLDEDNQDQKEVDLDEEEYKKQCIIYDIQQEMIEYVNNMSLPLCDYLTVEAIDNYILDLQNK